MTNVATLPSEPIANFEVEQMLLGQLMFGGDLTQAEERLQPEHFADEAHQQIYAAICDMADQVGRVEPQMLYNRLGSSSALADLGGVQYIAQLAASALSFVNVEDLAGTIRDLADRRALAAMLQVAASAANARANPRTAREQIEELEHELWQLASSTTARREPRGMADVMTKTLAQIEAAYTADAPLGVATGLAALDERLGGIRSPDLVVLAARPSMGKTALAVNIATNAAKAGKRAAVFSLEMAAEQVMLRIMAAEIGVPINALARGRIGPPQFQALADAQRMHSALPMRIDDTSAITPGHVRTEARRAARRMGGLDLIVIDYLQLMRPTAQRRNGNRTLEIGDMTAALKQTAKDLGCPILLLSQLSRANEQRDNKRPQLSDLRDSGAIEQDADIVLFLHREEYYLGRSEPDVSSPQWEQWSAEMDAAKGKAEIITAKFRQGAAGKDTVAFNGGLTLFSDLP